MTSWQLEERSTDALAAGEGTLAQDIEDGARLHEADQADPGLGRWMKPFVRTGGRDLSAPWRRPTSTGTETACCADESSTWSTPLLGRG